MSQSQLTWRGVFQFIAVIAALFAVRAWLRHDVESDAREALFAAVPAFTCRDISFDTKSWSWGTDIRGRGAYSHSELVMSRGCSAQLERRVRWAGWAPQRPCQSTDGCVWTMRNGAELTFRFENGKTWFGYREPKYVACLAKACRSQDETR